MANPLLTLSEIDEPAAAFLAQVGEVFAAFGTLTQNSGNLSYGVRVGTERYFVKTAGPRDGRDDPDVSHSHAQRVQWLRRAVALHRRRLHPAMPRLLHVIGSADGPLLVQAWVEAELLHTRRSERHDPAAAGNRFLALPVEQILDALDTVFQAHEAMASAGLVAVGFHEGSLMYDFARRRIHLIDLDAYHPGAFTNRTGRMLGSSRFMAPEEHQRGATIDGRTNVFTLGRAAAVFLGGGGLGRETFRGGDAQHAVVVRACEQEREQRHANVAELTAAWREARQADSHSVGDKRVADLPGDRWLR